jgi:hypothetical protein
MLTYLSIRKHSDTMLLLYTLHEKICLVDIYLTALHGPLQLNDQIGIKGEASGPRLQAGMRHLGAVRNETLGPLVLVRMLMVKIVDGQSELLATALLTSGQNGAQLVLSHEVFQVEIPRYLDLRLFGRHSVIIGVLEVVLSILLHWVFFIYFNPVLHGNPGIRHHVREVGPVSNWMTLD